MQNVIAIGLGLESLTSRRLYNDAAFIDRLISGLLNRHDCLGKVNFRLPALYYRNNTPFLVPRYSINLIENIPEYRLLKRCIYGISNFDFWKNTIAMDIS